MRFKFLPVFIVMMALAIISVPLLFDMQESSSQEEVTVKSEPQPVEWETAEKYSKSKEPISERKKRVKGMVNQGHPDLYAEWNRGVRTGYGQTKPGYEYNYKVKALLKAQNLTSTREFGKRTVTNQQIDWQSRGPGNVGGRTRGVIIDPTDPTYNTWFVGSVGGGVWKTTDAGTTWENLTEDLPNLATSTLAMSPANPDIIYAGTGEGFGNVDQIDGSGIWKSTDRGVTWEQLASTANSPEFENITRIIIDPSNPDVIVFGVAAGFNDANATNGVYKSIDGGVTVTKVFETGGFAVEHIIANPKNFNTQYATVNANGAFKSTDAGDSWFAANNGLAGVARTEIAISPVDTSKLYISAQGGAAGGSTLYKTTDGGASWLSANDPNGNVGWLGGQGWYDNTIAVHPYRDDVVFVGGIRMWRLDPLSGQDSVNTVTGVNLDNLASIPLSFVNFGGQFAGGGIDLGGNFHGLPTGLTIDDFTSIEVRFGPGKTQKGHRFLFAPGFQYPFQDYVDVPFEVWDTDNNVQLMVSWRDDENNGVYELEDRPSDLDGSGIDREYIFVHAVPYDSDNPDTNITQTAGQAYKNIYAMWPEAPPGAGVVNLDSLTADATIGLTWGTVITNRVTTSAVTPPGSGVHVDHHNIVVIPNDPTNDRFRIVNANDGGVYFSDDNGATWTNTLNSYVTTQYYGADKMNGADRYIGGMQDNGTWFSPEGANAATQYFFAIGGDGYESIWHYNNPNKLMGGFQFNGIMRSLDGGQTFNNANTASGMTDTGSGNAPFFTKIANSKQDPDLAFLVGASGVWRTDNFGASWNLTPMTGGGWNGTSSFSQVVVSLVNPQVVWAGRNMTPASPAYVSTDGGFTFNQTTVYSDPTLGPIGRFSGFDTHPTDDSTAYALFGVANRAKILRTTDLGQTWEDISGFDEGGGVSTRGFPDVVVHSLLVMPHNTDIIWAGTEIGIFESTDNGASWAFHNEGFPAVAAYEMKVVNDQVVVATHGRGIWSGTVPELAGYEPPPALLAPRFREVAGGAGGIVSVNLVLPSLYDSSYIMLDTTAFQALGANATPVDSSFQLMIPTEGLANFALSVVSYKDGQFLRSNPNNITVFPLAEAVVTYTNDFAENADDFVANGIAFDTLAGFSSGALHSPHPHGTNQDFTTILSIPIVVASENATIVYDDIAIIEPGNPGTVFGDPTFWDFVIVEGSNDNGTSWVPLADGYDARADSVWLDAYNNGTPGDSSMFRTQTVDLLNTYSPGDEVIIRFRLFSDPAAVGWGWAIDNIKIQEDAVVGIEDNPQIPVTYSLDQNYPNPFNPTTTIRYQLPEAGDVKINIYNILGQQVRTLVNTRQNAGSYSMVWDGRDRAGQSVASGMYIYRMESGNFVQQRKMMLIK